MDDEEIERRRAIVTEDYDGILPYCKEFYKLSIRYSAYQSRGSFIQCHDLLKFNCDAESVFGSLQEALSHASGLSRFFWPASNNRDWNKLAKKRADHLRDLLCVKNEDPLKDRSLRNTFEHFDEKLDQYLIVNDAGHFFPTPLIENYSLVDEPTGHIFKLIDPEAGKCILLGQTFDYFSIWKSVDRLYQRLK